jgi:hypothetical protein
LEFHAARGPEQGGEKFDERVSEANRVAAGAAAPAQENPTEERQILPPRQSVVAVATVRARRDYAFVFRESGQEDIQEAAEGETEQRGEGDPEVVQFCGDFDCPQWRRRRGTLTVRFGSESVYKRQPSGAEAPEIAGLNVRALVFA